MYLYLHYTKKYLSYFGIFLLFLCLLTGINTIANLNLLINFYNEKNDSLELMFSNIIIFLPFLLPIIYFYATNFLLSYLGVSNIIKRHSLCGRPNTPFYIVIISAAVICMIFSSLLTHIVVPEKTGENDIKLSRIIRDKPYLLFSPFVFNQVGLDYLVYFSEFGKDKKEIRNVIVYKLKKGRLKDITHVEQGYIDPSGDLVLANGLTVILGESGKAGKPVKMKDKVTQGEKEYEKIDRVYFQQLFPEFRERPDKLTTDLILLFLKDESMPQYDLFLELIRRFSLTYSIIFFMILSFVLFKTRLLRNAGFTIAVSSVISVLFIFKEIFLKVLLIIVFDRFVPGIFIIDLLFFLASAFVLLMIPHITGNRQNGYLT